MAVFFDTFWSVDTTMTDSYWSYNNSSDNFDRGYLYVPHFKQTTQPVSKKVRDQKNIEVLRNELLRKERRRCMRK